MPPEPVPLGEAEYHLLEREVARVLWAGRDGACERPCERAPDGLADTDPGPQRCRSSLAALDLAVPRALEANPPRDGRLRQLSSFASTFRLRAKRCGDGHRLACSRDLELRPARGAILGGHVAGSVSWGTYPGLISDHLG